MPKISVTLPSIYSNAVNRTILNFVSNTKNPLEIIVVAPFKPTIYWPTVHWIVEDQRRGIGQAHNDAAKVATGDFILGFADDFLVTKNWDVEALSDFYKTEEVEQNELVILGLRETDRLGMIFNRYYAYFPFTRIDNLPQIQGWYDAKFKAGFGDSDLSLRTYEYHGIVKPATKCTILATRDNANRQFDPTQVLEDGQNFLSRWGKKYGYDKEWVDIKSFNYDVSLEEYLEHA